MVSRAPCACAAGISARASSACSSGGKSFSRTLIQRQPPLIAAATTSANGRRACRRSVTMRSGGQGTLNLRLYLRGFISRDAGARSVGRLAFGGKARQLPPETKHEPPSPHLVRIARLPEGAGRFRTHHHPFASGGVRAVPRP